MEELLQFLSAWALQAVVFAYVGLCLYLVVKRCELLPRARQCLATAAPSVVVGASVAVVLLLLAVALLVARRVWSTARPWLGVRLPGRLGNHIFAFASSSAIASRNNMSVCVLSGQWLLAKVFVGPFPPACPSAVLWSEVPASQRYVPAPVADDKEEHDLTDKLRPHSWCFEDLGLTHIKRHTALSSLLQAHAYFREEAHMARSYLQFLPEIARAASTFLAGTRCARRGAGGEDALFVGVHVRRGDMQHAMARGALYHVAPAEYFARAMTHYRRRFGHVAMCFVVVSEARDTWWVRAQSTFRAPDVHVATATRSPGVDLAILAACNHSIISVGTFGWWGAFLAGGEATYYLPDRGRRPRACFDDYYLSNWTCIMHCDAEDDASLFRPGTFLPSTNASLMALPHSLSPFRPPRDFLKAAARMPPLERHVIVDGATTQANLHELLRMGEQDGRWKTADVIGARVLKVPRAVDDKGSDALIAAVQRSRDQSLDTVDAAPRHMLYLTVDELRNLIGRPGMSRLLKLPARLIAKLGRNAPRAWHAHIGRRGEPNDGEWTGLVLIAVREYARGRRPWIRLHHDTAAITVNVALHADAEFEGGQLVTVLDGALKTVVRAAGEATVHSSALVHGVTAVRGTGVRHTLILFFYAEEDTATPLTRALRLGIGAYLLFVAAVLARRCRST